MIKRQPAGHLSVTPVSRKRPVIPSIDTRDLLEIRTFGHVVIKWRAQARPLVMPPREAALLIYLAYQQVPVSRAHLCHLLWPDENSTRAHGNLRKLLLDTRRTVGSLIVATVENVGLHQEVTYWLDVHEFQWQMQPLDQIATANGDATIELLRLQRGLQLYQGDFLADLKLPKSYVFGYWCEQEQQRCHQQAIHALKYLVEAYKSQRHDEEAIRYTKRLFELDPLDEEAQEQRLLLFAQMGRMEEAIQQYHSYRSHIKSALAIEPEAHLTQLYQQIRAGIAPVISPIVQPVTRPSFSRSHLSVTQPPKALTPLFGRAESLKQLQALLTKPAVRLVTVMGMGGIGKTHFVLTFLERQSSDLPMQPVFVPLRAIQMKGGNEESADSDNRQNVARQVLTRAVAKAVDLPLAGTEMLRQQLFAYLQDQHLLFVLDSFEQWVAGSAFITELLQSAPFSKVLVTSREALQLPGEVILYLEGLPLPNVKEAAQFVTIWQAPEAEASTYVNAVDAEENRPALQLFRYALHRQSPQPVLSVESVQTIMAICHLVEGHPLAIELAAALSLHYSWLELADHLADDLTILQTAYQRSSEQQRSMVMVLEESWQMLTDGEQSSLQALNTFPGAFTRQQASEQAGTSPATLITLVNKSLLRGKGAGLYELPRLVRLFVQSKR